MPIYDYGIDAEDRCFYTIALQILSAEDGSSLATYPIETLYPIASSLSPEGDRLIVSHLNGQVSGFRLSDGSQIFETPAGDVGAISRTAFIPDGTRFITVATMRDSTQSVQFRDATAGRSLRYLRGGIGGIDSICIHPPSGHLLVAGACTATWELPKCREPAWRLPSTRLLSGFLGGDDLFLTPGEDPCVAAIDLEAAAPVWKPSHDSITTAATTADGSAAVAQVSLRQDGHRDFLIFQANRKIVREAGITRYGTDAQALALNHDGTRVGFSGAWGGISARLVSTGEELPPLDQFDIGYTLGLAWHGSDPTELIGIFTRHGHRGMPGAQEWIVA